MKKELLSNLSWLLLIALSCLIPVLTVYLDIAVLNNDVAETGVTETLQHLLLFFTTLIFIKKARQSNPNQGLNILIAGFFAVVLIREFDFLFDMIVHGFWKYPALIVTGISIALAMRHRHNLAQGLLDFTNSQLGLLIILGLIILLLFSRTLGTGSLWEAIVPNSEARFLTKTAVQEAIELLGYILIFWAGAINHYRQWRANRS